MIARSRPAKVGSVGKAVGAGVSAGPLEAAGCGLPAAPGGVSADLAPATAGAGSHGFQTAAARRATTTTTTRAAGLHPSRRPTLTSSGRPTRAASSSRVRGSSIGPMVAILSPQVPSSGIRGRAMDGTLAKNLGGLYRVWREHRCIEQREDIPSRHGSGEEEALGLPASERPQAGELVRGLDPFGRN